MRARYGIALGLSLGLLAGLGGYTFVGRAHATGHAGGR